MSAVDTGVGEWRGPAPAVAGLGAWADPEMERVARRVVELLGVPVALVSVVHGDRQVLPGQCGLAEPWASTRELPQAYTLCRTVVVTGEPVVVADARDGPAPRVGPVPGTPEVAGYAGMPLTVEGGAVLGALCAIDTAPRDWTPAELDVLADLARACAGELRLRLARHDALVERAGNEELRSRLAQALVRAQLLLRASQALSDVPSVSALRDRIADLVTGDLAPSRVALVITQNLSTRTRREDERGEPPPGDHYVPDGQWDEFDVADPGLVARAVRERQLVHVPDLRADGDVDDGERAAYAGGGVRAVTCAPVIDSSEVLGVLELTWDQPHEHDPFEHVVIATIAGYVATALRRARYLQHRISVARDLQEAMLTELPDVPGLRLAARYLPADTDEEVGGDWYDAFPLGTRQDTTVVVVGDVTGHDIAAATHMGQLRAMLRQACRQGRYEATPSAAVAALDDAVAGLGIGASGTALVAYLTPAGDGGRELTWTNAGHPPPIVVHPGGGTEILHPHDHLLGISDVFDPGREDHRTVLEPGSTLLLYTDGLVERQGASTDEEIERLAATAARLHHAGPAHLVDAVLAVSPGRYRHDDVVLFAVHVPATEVS